MRTTTIARLTALFILASLATGCAAMKRSAEQTRIRNARTQDHVYAINCPSVLSTAREIAFDRGLSIENSDTGTLTIETKWAEMQGGGSNVRERYLIRGSEPDLDQCEVSARRQERRANGSNIDSSRDLEFEWALLRLADPDAAAAIQAEVESVP